MADGILARVSELEFCKHDPPMASPVYLHPPGMLLCGFCYQAVRVLAEDIRYTR